jgi:ADP-heptose:LPS heptosyltransferase
MADSFLIALPHNLGDVIMGIPAAAGLKRAAPNARIVWLAETGFDDGVRNSPWCDDIVCFDRKQIRDLLAAGRWDRGIERIGEAVRDLESRTRGCIVNLSQNRYVAHLLGLVSASAGKGQFFGPEGALYIADDWSRYLYAIAYGRQFNELHATDVYRRIAGVADHAAFDTPRIRLDTHEIRDALEFLGSRGIDCERHKIMVFQPGAALPAKRWPLEHFVALGRMLIEQDWRIVVSGAPAESDEAAALCEQLGSRAVRAAGYTTFRQAIAQLSLARGCVSGDTALMHAAAALDVTAYAVFGPTNPVETGPYGEGHWVFAGGCGSRPCFCERCKSRLCTRSVLPRVVCACITRRNPGPGPGCDVFRTGFTRRGDYTLLPVRGSTNPYIDPGGARIVRRAFEPDAGSAATHDGDEAAALRQSAAFCERVRSMEKLLLAPSRETIEAFEQRKASLAELAGVAQFWTALLNIALNGIPVIDPAQAVATTARACAKLRQRIEFVTAAPPP